MFPWLIFALVAVPLIFVAYAASRRKTAAGERLEGKNDRQTRAEMEREFAEADAYEATWRKEDKKKYRREQLP